MVHVQWGVVHCNIVYWDAGPARASDSVNPILLCGVPSIYWFVLGIEYKCMYWYVWYVLVCICKYLQVFACIMY